MAEVYTDEQIQNANAYKSAPLVSDWSYIVAVPQSQLQEQLRTWTMCTTPAVWQPCELLYTCYLLHQAQVKQNRDLECASTSTPS